MNSLRITEILETVIAKAYESEFRSPDVSDGQNFWLARLVNRLPFRLVRRAAGIPVNRLVRYHPSLVRLFVRSNYIYPQGQAIFLRGEVNLLKAGSGLGDLELCRKIADWLLENRNRDFENYCWGQPFLWYSRKPFPPNLPRATVSSQVGWAFLDLFELTGDERYLDACARICDFFLEDLNRTERDDGTFCFSYTTADNYHIHNASLLAASVLMRVGCLLDCERYREPAYHATLFSVKHQNENGSWYYWAPPDGVTDVIDNYHTGFNLEALHTIHRDYPDTELRAAYEKGMEFYHSALFEDGLPRYTYRKRYPIDIQGCAQAIITFALARSEAPEYAVQGTEVLEYTIENFYLKDQAHFAYRIYENGFKDNSYYFRWGDAWMIRALSFHVRDDD